MTPELAKAAMAFLSRDLPLAPREINTFNAVYRALADLTVPKPKKVPRGKDSPSVS